MNLKNSLICTLTCLLISTLCFAETVNSTAADGGTTDIIFEKDNGTVTGYSGSTKDVIIPDSIGGVEVKSIGYSAFNRKSLNSVTIPSGVTSIGGNAFATNNLTTITLPDTLTDIGNGAFQYNSLTSVSIPNKVTKIESNAFLYNSITEVTMPDTISILGISAFNGNEITTVNGEPSNGIFYIRKADGTEDSTFIISYGGAAKVIDFIPANVKSIGERAFESNEITSVTIPKNVTFLGEDAFYNNSLTEVIFDTPCAITRIEDNAFYQNNITSITIPDGIESIGEYAFCNNDITSVSIAKSVVNIEGAAFNQNKITQVNNEPSIGLIYGRNADGSKDTTTIASYGGDATVIDFIPDYVTTLGKYSFRQIRLTSVNIPNSVTSIGTGAFTYNKLDTISIPSSVTSIGSYAFSGNKFNSIYLPAAHPYLPEGYKWSAGSTPYDPGTEVRGLSSSYMIYGISKIKYMLAGGINAENNPSIYLDTSGVKTLAIPTKVGYTFAGWFNSETMKPVDTVGNPAIAKGSTEDTVFYAKWLINKYNIFFDSNGGDGNMSDMIIPYKKDTTITTNTYTKDGHIFAGWNTAKNGSDVTYTDGADITINMEDITLYAQWTKVTSITDAKDNNIKVYPNPAKDNITITNIEKGTNIILLNAIGNILINEKANDSEVTLNISSYPSGLYYVKIETQIEKIIIE